MSDIKKTMQEECYGTCWAACERIEELETQLISATNRIKRLEGELESTKADRDSWSNQSDEFAKTAADLIIRIKRLEEAGDAMHWAFAHHDTVNESVAAAWRKAKEDKP